MGCITPNEPVGVTGCIKSAHLVHSRLNGEFLAGFEFMLPFFPDLLDYSGKFMTDNSWIDINIVWNALMISTLDSCFMRRHADAIGNYTGKDLIILQCGQFKFFEPQILFTVYSNSLCLHSILINFFFTTELHGVSQS